MIYIVPNIIRVQQFQTWDCGLACIQSIFNWYNNNSGTGSIVGGGEEMILPKSYQELCELLNTENIWSIDLSNLLNRFKIQHEFYTINIDLNQDHYSKSSFYQLNWDQDSKRISKILNSSDYLQESLKMVEISVTDMIIHLKKQLPIILLVDSRYLLCNACELELPSLISSSSEDTIVDYNVVQEENYVLKTSITDFVGHFIILFGYDEDKNSFLFIDPASFSQQYYCTMSIEDIDFARKQPGTDMDAILIYS